MVQVSSWLDIGKELKTIYEFVNSSLHEEIRKVISNSDEIHFLGFGFNSSNLELLGINNWRNDNYISGTRFNLSEIEIEDINYLFQNKLKNLSKESDKDCIKYLKGDIHFFVDKKRKARIY